MKQEPQNPIAVATGHLFMIKARLLHLRDVLALKNVQSLSINRLVRLDHAYLDIRKIIEEMLLMSLSAHAFAQVELGKRLRKEWHADRIISGLEAINPRFYPEAIIIEPCDEEGVAGRFRASDADCLSKADLTRLYGLCGDVLHTKNRLINASEIEQRLESAAQFNTQISNLLTCFEIDLSGQNMTVLGQLLMDEPHKPPELFHTGIAVQQ